MPAPEGWFGADGPACRRTGHASPRHCSDRPLSCTDLPAYWWRQGGALKEGFHARGRRRRTGDEPRLMEDGYRAVPNTPGQAGRRRDQPFSWRRLWWTDGARRVATLRFGARNGPVASTRSSWVTGRPQPPGTPAPVLRRWPRSCLTAQRTKWPHPAPAATGWGARR